MPPYILIIERFHTLNYRIRCASCQSVFTERRLIDGPGQFDSVVIYGDTEDISDRVGVVTFNFIGVNSCFPAVNPAGRFLRAPVCVASHGHSRRRPVPL